MKNPNIKSFENWYIENEEELDIKFAETGADRELDFDYEEEIIKEYKLYVQAYLNNTGET